MVHVGSSPTARTMITLAGTPNWPGITNNTYNNYSVSYTPNAIRFAYNTKKGKVLFHSFNNTKVCSKCGKQSQAKYYVWDSSYCFGPNKQLKDFEGNVIDIGDEVIVTRSDNIYRGIVTRVNYNTAKVWIQLPNNARPTICNYHPTKFFKLI